ncbi:hypothetical protein UFOVP1255_2 [uncultured Caudovirales phage]|uniref:Uncharacterized protein n=1 Tax=uncultured Caudovirales phage TaxID=2100421 RepID=A0A6J5PX49_9CAUD|nr:hypothetical protein UFOVP973_22 [uncultured Caudovirales phage]CAB4194021.1 hypothetical protein UFOVP1255_2 [uncultured Caudovirales phage]CAB4216908.1 hypothetical protein UFOVP1496_21 [uncultured Caudovirales phage]
MNNWTALTLAIITIVTAFVGSVRWLVKHYLAELRDDGNGGHNLRGRIDRIEKQVDAIYQIILEDRLAK